MRASCHTQRAVLWAHSRNEAPDDGTAPICPEGGAMSGDLLKEPEWLHQMKPGRHVCPECSGQRRPEHRTEKTLRIDDTPTGRAAYSHPCLAKAIMTHDYSRGSERVPHSRPSVADNVVPLEPPAPPPRDLDDHRP